MIVSEVINVILRSWLLGIGCAGLLAIACGSESPSGSEQDVGPGGNDPNGQSSGSSGFGSSGSDPSADGGDGPTCAASVAQTTKPKVDIIFVIDNSGSMGEEMAQVQANVVTFVQKLGGSGLDYNVIFIVTKTGSRNICVPEPLAKAGCADNPPIFHHINQSVGSSNSLSLVLSTYDSNDAALAWNKHLRMDAFKVFVEVSDDGNSDQNHATFDAALIAKGAGQFGTAEKRNYTFHAICGWKEGTAFTSADKCSTADGAGMQYRQLATLTGGIIDSVCKTDYSGVLDNIGKGIIDRLACELGYPTAQAADPSKVQVRFTPAGKAAETLPQVTDASKCAANPNGWYYDDPAQPAKIILCKPVCDAANSTQGSKIEALVGCKGSGPK